MAEVLSVMQLIIRKSCREFWRALLAAALVLIPLGADIVAADTTWTQTSQADFESGALVQLDTSGSPGDVMLAKTGGSYLYALSGNNTKKFWRYDVAADNWTPLADCLQNIGAGGALAYDGANYIYALAGGGTKYFLRYNIATNTWASSANTPSTVNAGGALVFTGSYLYAFRGGGSSNFWRYSVASNTWSSRASALAGVKGGGALTYDGGNYIYALGGMSTYFWRYSISGNSWSWRASTPSSVGDGGSLAGDGGNYVYALKGANTTTFWRYDITGNSWAAMADTPETPCVYGGGALVYDKEAHLYALRGNNEDDFWKYDVSSNSWSIKANVPVAVLYGGALAFKGTSYYSSGNLTSSTHDSGYSANFSTLSWTASTPAGTSVKFQIAANSDNATWVFKGPDGATGTYYTSSGTDIWSGHDGSRYIKYKAFLSTANTSLTPVLNDVSIAYTPQIVLPSASTSDATLVEETTATFHGAVTDDGGEPCQYRFEYGTGSGNYTADTGWTGNLTTGQTFSSDVTGLGKGTKYYFRAQVKKSAGIGSGNELDFLTKPDPPVEGTFTASVVSDTEILLSWTKGEGALNTMIRRKSGDFPVDRNDGVLVYFGPDTSFTDTGLTPLTTYYYCAWSQVIGSEQWSDGFRAVAVTSGLEPPVAVGGPVYPVNKAQVLMPWLIALFISILVVSGVIVRIIGTRRVER